MNLKSGNSSSSRFSLKKRTMQMMAMYIAGRSHHSTVHMYVKTSKAQCAPAMPRQSGLGSEGQVPGLSCWEDLARGSSVPGSQPCDALLRRHPCPSPGAGASPSTEHHHCPGSRGSVLRRVTQCACAPHPQSPGHPSCSLSSTSLHTQLNFNSAQGFPLVLFHRRVVSGSLHRQ